CRHFLRAAFAGSLSLGERPRLESVPSAYATSGARLCYHRVRRVEDLPSHLVSLDEACGDWRGARRDVTRVAVEVELRLLADRLLRTGGRRVRPGRHPCPVAAGREIVSIDRDLRSGVPSRLA